MKRLLVLCCVTLLVSASVAAAPPSRALPGPSCPGNGNDSVAIGADGGWCNFMYMPDGSHVSCRWVDFAFLLGEIGGHTECRRVDAHGNLLPDSPPWNLMSNWGADEGSNGTAAPPPPGLPGLPLPPLPPLPGLPPPTPPEQVNP